MRRALRRGRTLAERWWTKAKKMENNLECLGSSKTYLRAGIEGAKRGEGRVGTSWR